MNNNWNKKTNITRKNRTKKKSVRFNNSRRIRSVPMEYENILARKSHKKELLNSENLKIMEDFAKKHTKTKEQLKNRMNTYLLFLHGKRNSKNKNSYHLTHEEVDLLNIFSQ